jgi:hypothetical protein
MGEAMNQLEAFKDLKEKISENAELMGNIVFYFTNFSKLLNW